MPKYNRNEFGGNVSGPISIPHLYDGRDKSFFFFNYEGFRRLQAATLTSQVPTLERSGNFSELVTVAAPVAIRDPLIGLPFANNVIPAERINPVTAKLQDILFPLPTWSELSTI